MMLKDRFGLGQKQNNMKTLILILWSGIAFSQLPYTWNIGVNPGWTSSNPSNYTLAWQPYFGGVSTSNTYPGGTYFYNNSQNTYYTSPVYNMMCDNASMVHVSIFMTINLENNWDYLYFQYSTNGGATWTTLGTWTGSIGLVAAFYDIPESTTMRFRFRFQSDSSVNSYWCGPFSTCAYYADIQQVVVECITYLPIELVEYSGEIGNHLWWQTNVEVNNDYFKLEHSTDGESWNTIATVNSIGSNGGNYDYWHEDYREGYNYYRLKQYDMDGTETNLGIVVIDNREEPREVIRIVNSLGQEVGENETGVVFYYYSDGTIEKRFK